MTNLDGKLSDGPWTSEPDEEVFIYQNTRCVMSRMPGMGFVNGYIELPKEHPHFGQEYTSWSPNVHGGITYARSKPPLPGWIDEAPTWWVGFDTGHTWDLAPAFKDRLTGIDKVYRDWKYVRAQIKLLVRESQEVLYRTFLEINMKKLPSSFLENGEVLKLTYPGYTPAYYRYRSGYVELWTSDSGWCSSVIQEGLLTELSKDYKYEIVPHEEWRNKMTMHALEAEELL